MEVLYILSIVIQLYLTMVNTLKFIDGDQDLTKTLSIIFFWPLHLLKHLWWGLLLVFTEKD